SDQVFVRAPGELVINQFSLETDTEVTVDGHMDVLGNSDTEIGALFGAGTVALANADLIVSGAGGNFQGVISGDSGSEVVVQDGADLTLGGQNTYTGVTTVRESGSTLRLDGSEVLHDSSDLVLLFDGTLVLGGSETVDSFRSGTIADDDDDSGGNVGGSGLLTAMTYDLNDGTFTDAGAHLGKGDLTSEGDVQLDGNTDADTIDIRNGVFTTNGDVTNGGSIITIQPTGGWAVNGNYVYDTVRGTGSINPGGINGDTFVNTGTMSPGFSHGTITVMGDYEDAGTYDAELTPFATAPFPHYRESDKVDVSGFTTLQPSSVLELTAIHGLNSGNVLCGERWNIIDSAGGIFDGDLNDDIIGYGEITDVDNAGPNGVTFDSQVLFDVGKGDVVALGLAAGETVADYDSFTPNKAAILQAVIDSATDRVGNYRSDDGGAGTVLDAVYLAGDPGDKDALMDAVIRLSPEGYAGVVDYALHVTRGYSQNVMRHTPRLGGAQPAYDYPDPGPKGGMVNFEDSEIEPAGAKGVMPYVAPAAASGSRFEVFGGYSHNSVESDASIDQRDYDIRSNGGYAGVKLNTIPNLAVGGFLAIDTGSVKATGLSLDASGLVMGAFVESTPQGPDGPLLLYGNLAYGTYEFDGSRTGLLGTYTVPNFDANAFQVAIGADYDWYQRDAWTVTPGIGLRYVDATTDAFTETGGPGAYKIGDMDQDALLLDLTLKFFYQQIGQPFAMHGHLGYQHDFSDSDREVQAMLASGGPAFSVVAPGIGEDAVTFGLGGHYDFNDRYRLGLSYRGELREDADLFHGLDVRFTVGF
ncbi:MAG: autotransporter domain-containing protein, partial [Akkermansiaceae bacterium]|nr:autotransporter domain-containing protein [Akkermansiaceae bacterium]